MSYTDSKFESRNPRKLTGAGTGGMDSESKYSKEPKKYDRSFFKSLKDESPKAVKNSPQERESSKRRERKLYR